MPNFFRILGFNLKKKNHMNFAFALISRAFAGAWSTVVESKIEAASETVLYDLRDVLCREEQSRDPNSSHLGRGGDASGDMVTGEETKWEGRAC